MFPSNFGAIHGRFVRESHHSVCYGTSCSQDSHCSSTNWESGVAIGSPMLTRAIDPRLRISVEHRAFAHDTLPPRRSGLSQLEVVARNLAFNTNTDGRRINPYDFRSIA
jgi:hypothetical protein